MDNFSDHLPIYVVFRTKLYQHVSAENPHMYANWAGVSRNAYYGETRDRLYDLHNYDRLCCKHICCDSGHSKLIDEYCDNVVCILHDSTKREGLAWNNVLDAAKRKAKTEYKHWISLVKLGLVTPLIVWFSLDEYTKMRLGRQRSW